VNNEVVSVGEDQLGSCRKHTKKKKKRERKKNKKLV
jgi:hypothetical protein